MSTQQGNLLLCLQSSMRNAHSTFGPTSPQYINIKAMVDELAMKIALDKLSLSANESPQEDQKMSDA
ncbi:hypothetical protein FB567DRAFT_587088 [Paraphoma chrysanthemicola]|uniref:Uncharacterized protein n=1 Tax=Paraphoma chrysanthemicola TaxID=798071 RepID=A0A8K0RJ69_9PLEO|nr:hypothetical protein FB567DRAFT_587088 [Paraphoma chrysanthemicola]